MESHFSELQNELHLPEANNHDPKSAENTIIAYNVPSVYRYAWYSKHVVDLDFEKVDGKLICKFPKQFHKMVGLEIVSDDVIENISLVRNLESGESLTLQEFDQTMIKVLGSRNLPWFFKDGRYCLDMMLYEADIELIVEASCLETVKIAGVYQSITGSQGFHKSRDSGYPLMLCETWYPLDKLEESGYDSILALYFHVDKCPDRIKIKIGDIVFCDCSSVFLKQQLGEKKDALIWKNYYEEHKIHPGVPKGLNISMVPEEGFKVYALVCKRLRVYM